MHQTILIIAVRHVLSLREYSETHYTHFLLQLKNLNFFFYLLPIAYSPGRSVFDLKCRDLFYRHIVTSGIIL